MAVEVLDDSLHKVIHHAPSRFNRGGVPFLIARTMGGVTVKGEMRKPVLHHPYRFYGEWVEDRKRNETQFAFSQYEALIGDGLDGLKVFLARHVPTLGSVRAGAIVDHFGMDTVSVLKSDPSRIAEVPGLNDRIAGAVREYFESQEALDPAAYARLVDLFSDIRIPKRVIESLVKDFGSGAADYVREHPYHLLDFPRVGWSTVDPFAQARCEYPEWGIARQMAAICEAFTLHALEGHTYAQAIEIDQICAAKLIGFRPEPEAWAALLAQDKIVTDDGRPPDAGDNVAIKRLDVAERSIARHLARLSAAAGPLDFSIDDAGLLDGQKAGVRMVEESGICLFTGGPGTGKTYTITRSIRDFLAHDVEPIAIVTPTGKAAKRAEELLRAAAVQADIPCATIHKFLVPVPSDEEEGISSDNAKVGRGRSGFTFQHNEACPVGERVVVVDETSMVDVSLGASLLSAIPDGTRVIFVGDHNQLPSVGPGSVLRDMMEGGLPCNVLTEIQRSAGTIVRACHAIKDGKVPVPADRLDLEASPPANWIHIELEEPGDIADEIVELHRTVKSFDPVWGMQVVTPQKTRLLIACENLNDRLSSLLNPLGGSGAEGESDDGPPVKFRIGDKIIRTKNGVVDGLQEYDPEDPDTHRDLRWRGRDWSFADTAVVNGDMGTLVDIIEGDKQSHAVVQLLAPDRLVRIPMSDPHLERAYAVTCHKAQGSGFPYVIVPVHLSFYFDSKTGTGLFTREWLYTAVSRAEKVLVTVGQWAAIEQAVRRKTVHKRRTRLAERIRHAMAVHA